MTTINERAQTFVHQLEDLMSDQMAIFAYRQDFSTLEHKFVTEVDAKRHTRTQHNRVLSPAMSDVLDHWNVHVTERSSAEQALWSRKRKLEQDVQRSKTAVGDALCAHLETLPMDTQRLLKTDPNADQETDELEQEMYGLREAVDRVNLASIDEEDKTQARFLSRWADER